jgi:hypothetical protein
MILLWIGYGVLAILFGKIAWKHFDNHDPMIRLSATLAIAAAWPIAAFFALLVGIMGDDV